MYADVIIIGAGPSGLYTAHNLRKKGISSLILERKSYIGGRSRIYMFEDKEVYGGASIIRKQKDLLATKLFKEFGVSYSFFKSPYDYSYVHPIDILDVMKKARSLLTHKNKYMNTKSFIITYFGLDAYNHFTETSAHTDYECECITDTIGHYGMDDNVDSLEFSTVKWNALWEKVSQGMNILYDQNVSTLLKQDDLIVVDTTTQKFYAKNVIIATDIITTRRLLPNFDIYNHIEPQPFIKTYAFFNKKGQQILKSYITKYTPVQAPLQSVLDMGDGLYMIAYSDGVNATMLYTYTHDTVETRRFYENVLTQALSCPDLQGTIVKVRGYYTSFGIHYYKALYDDQIYNDDIVEDSLIKRKNFIYEAQHPQDHVFVVGEAVSLKQGWTEGALESVEAIMLDILMF